MSSARPEGGGMERLLLRVTDFIDAAHWNWILSDSHGNKLAEKRVSLDTRTNDYKAFIDLHQFLEWRVTTDEGASSEAALIGRLSRWIGRQVFGPVGIAI